MQSYKTPTRFGALDIDRALFRASTGNTPTIFTPKAASVVSLPDPVACCQVRLRWSSLIYDSRRQKTSILIDNIRLFWGRAMKFVATLLGQHLARYPLMALPDIYKLLHQAAMGSGHAVTDLNAARQRLSDEAGSLTPGTTAEPLLDPISPDGKLARVHLRPYLAARMKLDDLARAFVHTAQAYPPAPDKLLRFCSCLGDLADGQKLPFTRQAIEAYVAQIAAENYPAVHHSRQYEDAYRPAYRVIATEFLNAIA